MGIMQFESWQARGFGVPVLGRSGAGGEEVLSALPRSSVWKTCPKCQKPRLVLSAGALFGSSLSRVYCAPTVCRVLC